MKQIFTKQERLVLYFLVSGLVIGAGIKLINPNYKANWSNQEEFASFEQQLQTIESSSDSIKRKKSKAISIVRKKRRDFKININQASVDEIVQLPKIGPVLASRIVAYRQKHGYFHKVEDLINVKGVGKKTVERLRPFISVTPIEQ